MSMTKEMLVALALILGIIAIPASCRCGREPGPVPKPDPPPAVQDAAPEASAPTEKVWEPVTNLDTVEGSWGSKDNEEGWAEVSSRATAKENGDPWRYPYPWHLLLHPPETEVTYDCGFHESLEEPADAGAHSWRVAWCEGGELEEGRRHAKRLVLRKREEAVEFLLIDINGLPTVELDRR